MNKFDRLFRAESDLLETNKQLAIVKNQNDLLKNQVSELREIIAKLTKSRPNS